MKKIKAELESIRKRNGGRLTPASVLQFAEARRKSAIYAAIEKAGLWDDAAAAAKARLFFCQHLIIRAKVLLLTNGKPKPYRAYVSVLSGRGGGEYDSTFELMQSEDGREAILETAMAELRAFKRKYSMLKELAPVFESINDVESILVEKAA